MKQAGYYVYFTLIFWVAALMENHSIIFYLPAVVVHNKFSGSF